MWYDEAVFYQIYPLGFCGALYENDGITVSRIQRVIDWIPHLIKTGVNAVYFSPIFESDYHGYDTRDYTKIDCRLGTNEDFKQVVSKLHENGIKVIIDGVFNHVGRGFSKFQDVIAKRENSAYKDWFYIDFSSNSAYNDGLSYEGWEGCYNLVKLNLNNREVVDYLFFCVKMWVDEFHIDGIRLDVAYCLNHDFMRNLRKFTDNLKDEFFLLGEMIHGDYNTIVNEGMLHSATNYECYKGLHSSFNSMNLFEIAHSINRQFGKENWTLYRGKHLLTFVDNHDVNRIASVLSDKNHIPLIYGLAMAMPGIPCIYYGSEWGAEGIKENGGDNVLRVSFEEPIYNEITEKIAAMAYAHRESKALCYGEYSQLLLTNRQFIFERVTDGEKVIVAINADNQAFDAAFHAGFCKAVDLLTGEEQNFGNSDNSNISMQMKPYSVSYWKCI